MIRPPGPSYRSSGFTLIELAIVLVIIGLLLGGALIPLSATMENSRRADAAEQLDDILAALYGFAQANGRLPCPATAASAGAEAPAGGGACTRQHGFVPAVTLGLPGAVNVNGLLADPWNNPYRYSVTTANSNAFTTTNGIRGIGIAAAAPDLQVWQEAAHSNQIAADVPAVVLSMGKNWATFTHADEIDNSGEITVAGYRMANDLNFVNSGYSEQNFDDLITWLSPHLLYSRMIAAGQLP